MRKRVREVGADVKRKVVPIRMDVYNRPRQGTPGHGASGGNGGD